MVDKAAFLLCSKGQLPSLFAYNEVHSMCDSSDLYSKQLGTELTRHDYLSISPGAPRHVDRVSESRSKGPSFHSNWWVYV